MSENIDKLQMLKSRYLERLRKLDSERVDMLHKIDLIETFQRESALITNEVLKTSASESIGYADFGLTEAVLDATLLLAKTGHAWVTAAKVATVLLDNGFKSKNKDARNFKIGVGLTLKRLVGQGKMLTELRDGERLFSLKNQFSEVGSCETGG